MAKKLSSLHITVAVLFPFGYNKANSPKESPYFNTLISVIIISSSVFSSSALFELKNNSLFFRFKVYFTLFFFIGTLIPTLPLIIMKKQFPISSILKRVVFFLNFFPFNYNKHL